MTGSNLMQGQDSETIAEEMFSAGQAASRIALKAALKDRRIWASQFLQLGADAIKAFVAALALTFTIIILAKQFEAVMPPELRSGIFWMMFLITLPVWIAFKGKNHFLAAGDRAFDLAIESYKSTQSQRLAISEKA